MSLFGTDGIRGQAGRFPLDESTITAVALSAGRRLSAQYPGRPFLLARDTRVSGPWIRDLVMRALASQQITVIDAGVLPTPAAAILIPRRGCCGGLMISASHNPARDNGLKFLTADGLKLPDDMESAIEAELDSIAPRSSANFSPPALDAAAFRSNSELLDAYLSHLLQAAPPDTLPAGKRVVVDCANGAASPVVRELAARLPLDLVPVFAEPDGLNINHDCGATHPEALSIAVQREGAALGIALDGDADRIIIADGSGTILDGDSLLYIFSRYLDRQGHLPHHTTVGTVMTNLGLETALSATDIHLVRTPVGDRHIQACMLRDGYAMGGEPSGHIILGPWSFTGDGLLTGIYLLRILGETGATLTELLAGYEPFPSRIINLHADRKPPLEDLPVVTELKETVNRNTDSAARVVIRYSGTEPLLRIMVEARNLDHALQGTAALLDELTATLKG